MSVAARWFFNLVVLLLFAARTLAQGQLMYDNSGPGDPTGVWYSMSQYGDEIILGTNLTSHVLTQLQIEYYGDFKPSGDEMGEIRLYKNDGPPYLIQGYSIPTPGTLLYDSGKFSLAAGYETWTSTFLNVTLPDDVTWTIQFSGLTGQVGDRAGLLFQNPPTVGRSYSDAWLDATAGWQTVMFSQPANFAARLTSDLPVISIRQTGSTVTLEWTGASVLQMSNEAGSGYVDLPQYRNKYTFSTASAGRKFWRLRD